MNKMMKYQKPLAIFAGWFALALTSGLGAEPAGAAVSGAIEGRVLNVDNGQYVAGARVTVGATALETFTDSSGYYRLTHVPSGPAKVNVFFTGVRPAALTIPVAAGETARGDFELSSESQPGGKGRSGEVVKLDAFVVATRKDMDGAAIAINEQRFAPNIKNVVTTDEFGGDAEGNVGEFLKFLPGMSVGYAGGNARSVSLGGVPAAYVPMTINGFSLASPGLDSGTNRSVALDFMSLNNLSRIEVEYAPTPESQGGALAGTVNMVPRSAFERARPTFDASVYLTMRDDARDFHKSVGPFRAPSRKVHPGADFSYVVPVNARFGFTLSGSNMMQYAEEDILLNTWRGVNAATNGVAFPNTTPDKPYLTAVQVSDSGKDTTRRSLAATFDFKFGKYDRLSLGYQYAFTRIDFSSRFLIFNVTRVLPGDFTTTSTRSAAGGANVTTTNNGRSRDVPTNMPSVIWRHDGPVWKTEAGASVSESSNLFRDIQKGRFLNPQAQRAGLTIAFNDFSAAGNVPRQITVTDGVTGLPVDPYRLDTYAVSSGNTTEALTRDIKRTAYANARHDFQGRVPFSLKAGVDARQSIRDTRGTNFTLTYVGRDGRASTSPIGSDDSAAPFLDAANLQNHVGFGFPTFQALNPWLLWEQYAANPATFTKNENGAYTNEVNLSKYARELVSSAYLRGDVSLLDGRLKLVGGVRAEQTNINAEGPLTAPTRNYQYNSAGRPILGADGKPILISPANSLDALKRTLVMRGAHAEKEYLRLFPSLNANYTIRENLIVRAAHYTSVGRPDYSQYAGGLALPDTEQPPGPGNRISISNAGIKAWSAQTTNLRLEYYFEGVGMVSVGVFRREFENFFGSYLTRATPEFLGLYALDQAQYGAYDVSTEYNLPGTVRNQGWDVNYKQALTFLPHWARGVQIFANSSSQTVTGGAGASNLSGFVPHSANWGVSLARPKYSVRVNWNYRGRAKGGLVAAGASIDPETYNYTAERLTFDVIAEYYVWKRIAVYANLRNVSDKPILNEISGPTTPVQAQFRQSLRYGSLWTFGVKGSF